MFPRFFHRMTGNETSKQAFLPKSVDFGSLYGMLQDPCATPICLPLDFLKAITRDFSKEQEIGRGGYGVVYKGVLQNGKAIAVKKLSEMNLEDAQFQNEVIYLIGLKHQNIVQLVGYCAESRWEATQVSGKYVMAEIRKRLLCFEYLNNSSLDKHLSAESCGLKWNIRYEIIKGICCGLHYLHTECHIVHLDLKPENILLDDSMVPKIADFGMSRLFGEQQSRIITESRVGTCGYMAPEYLINGLISTKSDIFSLGVIIIELMTGSRDYPQSSETLFELFIKNVVDSWKNSLEKAPKCIPLEAECQQVNTCIVIGLNCVDPDPKRRPSALDIIQMLDAVGSANRHTLETEIDTFSRSCSANIGHSVGMMDCITILNKSSTSRTANISSLFTFSAKAKGSIKISIRAFEFANTIVNSSNLMKMLSRHSMNHLKERLLSSEGIRRLISEDHNELLVLVEADIRGKFKRFCKEVSRFGDLCIDPSLHNLTRYFHTLKCGQMTPQKILLNKELFSNIQYLSKLENYTSELRQELILLDKLESEFHLEMQKDGFVRSERNRSKIIQALLRSVKRQRSVVKNLKNKSLWSKMVDDIVEKLVDIVHLLHFEISCAFLKNHGDQSPAPATNLCRTLGPTGLALHYANVILQINTLVLTLPVAVSDKSRDALYKALSPSIKSKLRGFYRREKTMTVAEARAEMDRILRWLVPVAEATTLYYKNGEFGEWTNMVEPDDIDVEEPHCPRQEERHFIAVASTSQGHVVNKIDTLYHADKQRTEGYIVDLIRGLQYMHIY